jgi:hypothetical protein
VVLIHHPSKSDPTGLRGHGSLLGKCDAVIHIEIEEQTGVRIATLNKARDDADGLQLRFELDIVPLKERDSWGDPQTTVVVKLATQPKPRKLPKAKNQQKLLFALQSKGDTAWTSTAIHKIAKEELGMHRNSGPLALKGLWAKGFFTEDSSPLHMVLRNSRVEMVQK